MRRRPTDVLIWTLLSTATTAIALHPPIAAAQQAPTLQRTFSAGAPERYRVRLVVRSEMEARRPLPIGAQTYVEPVSRVVEYSLSWRASRRIVTLAADGSAEIEEALDEFDTPQGTGRGDDDETKKMNAALRSALEAFSSTRTLQYRETSAGQISGLKEDGVPALGENPPPILTLWLLRALRPAAALPSKPLNFGEKWNEPRAVNVQNWSNAHGVESGEWLEAGDESEPAARLHVVQQISGRVASGADLPEAGAAQARFHGESLTTLSMLNGRALSAERSALREISWVLSDVPGLPEPQQFRARLSVQVKIEDCNENPCLAPGSNSSQREHE